MKVKIYVEGGGDSKELHARCREGFRKLTEKAGFEGRMPRFIPCGGRTSAYEDFRIATNDRGAYPMLLVDSEDIMTEDEGDDSDSAIAWEHLKVRDDWDRPSGANNDQAVLMVTCMETWIMADREALGEFFGQHLQVSALLHVDGLEKRTRQEVQDALQHATRNCGKNKRYRKGAISFRILSLLNPENLKPCLGHFRRFLNALDQCLQR